MSGVRCVVDGKYFILWFSARGLGFIFSLLFSSLLFLFQFPIYSFFIPIFGKQQSRASDSLKP